MIKVRYKIVSSTGLIFLTLFALFLFIFYTEIGLRYTLSVAGKFIPGKLIVAGVHGCLAEQANIDVLSYQNKKIKITGSNIQLTWQPFYLLQDKLIIKKLLADNITIETEPAFLKPIKIDDLTCTLLMARKQIDSVDLALQSSYGFLKINGRLTQQYDFSWNINIQRLGNIFQNINGSLTGQGEITGPKSTPEMNTVFNAKQLYFMQNSTNAINLSGKLNAQLNKQGLSAKATIIPEKQTAIFADLFIDKKKKFQVSIQKKDAYIPETNLTLKNIQLSAEGDFSKARYRGKTLSGKGYLEINGETSFKKPGFPSEINIVGDEFLVSNTDTINVSVSPTLKLLFDNKRLDVDGTISIPQAKIEPHDFRNTETLPKDVVFVNQRQQYVSQDGFTFYSHIKLMFGNHVYLNAMGIKGRLTGQLDINDQPGTQTEAKGSLSIHHGSYDLYGQELTLRRSELIFSEPIDNPALDIRAVRVFKTPEIKDLTVGAHVTGTLIHPRTELFSDPYKLSQEDIISYLMFGQPITQVGQNNAVLIIRAAEALNFGGSGKLTELTDKLRERFGLAEFGLRAEVSREAITTTSFVMGKYLSPRLYVSYSIGLIDPVNIFRVRYRFNKRWMVQSNSSSIGNGLDLLYSITKD
jgi:autotransporter translocation and assembly factor TamB